MVCDFHISLDFYGDRRGLGQAGEDHQKCERFHSENPP